VSYYLWVCWLTVAHRDCVPSCALYSVYTIQPVVKPGCATGFTTGCIHDTAVCQTGCQTGCANRFDNRLFVCMHDTTSWQPVWQPVASCIQTFTRLSNRIDNRFDNRLHPVNGALEIFLLTDYCHWSESQYCRRFEEENRRSEGNIFRRAGCIDVFWNVLLQQ